MRLFEWLTCCANSTDAMEWTSDHISVWSWTHSAKPADIATGTPNPEAWGEPSFHLSSATCDIDRVISRQKLVLNIAFCGDLAGEPNIWRNGCRAHTGFDSCQDYVGRTPDVFQDTYFNISSIKVYTRAELLDTTPTISVPGTSSPTTTTISTTTAVTTTGFPISSINSTSRTSSTSGYFNSTPTSAPLTTSTIYSSTIYTVTACPKTVTNCPASSTYVVTSSVAVSTTICPVGGGAKSTPYTSPVQPSTEVFPSGPGSAESSMVEYQTTTAIPSSGGNAYSKTKPYSTEGATPFRGGAAGTGHAAYPSGTDVARCPEHGDCQVVTVNSGDKSRVSVALVGAALLVLAM